MTKNILSTNQSSGGLPRSVGLLVLLWCVLCVCVCGPASFFPDLGGLSPSLLYYVVPGT